MPTTITSYHDFGPGQRAYSAEVDENFSNHRGTLLPIEESTAGASHNSHDLGSLEHQWRNIYLQSMPLVGGFPSDRLISAATSGTYTIANTVRVLLASCSSGAWVATLPLIANCTGTSVIIKKTSQDSNLLTIDGNGVETIDDTTVMYLARQYQWVELFNGGTQWHRIGQGGSRETSSSAVTFSNFFPNTSGTDFFMSGCSVTIPTTGKRVEIFLEAACVASVASYLQYAQTGGAAGLFGGYFTLYDNSSPVGIIGRYTSANTTVTTQQIFAPDEIRFNISASQGSHKFDLYFQRQNNTYLNVSSIKLTAREVD